VDDPNTLNRDALRNVATYQKGILVCILFYIVLVVIQFLLPPDLRLFLGIAAVVLSITATVFVFLLATQVYSTGLGVLLAILTLIPCIGLITLLIINNKATNVLRKHGVRVGLLGAKPSDIK
jgi:hypothetical protein